MGLNYIDPVCPEESIKLEHYAPLNAWRAPDNVERNRGVFQGLGQRPASGQRTTPRSHPIVIQTHGMVASQSLRPAQGERVHHLHQLACLQVACLQRRPRAYGSGWQVGQGGARHWVAILNDKRATKFIATSASASSA